MHVIFIRNYKMKSMLLGLFALLWGGMFMLSNYLMHTTMALQVTINDYLTFSYPFNLQVINVYYHEQFDNKAIQTNSNFRKPIAQKFSNYKSINGKFSFQYPSAFSLNEQDFTGSEILYHIDFANKPQNNTHGFVQVWNLPYNLQDFLGRSKSTSTNNYSRFESKPITVNSTSGYLWDYSVLGKDGGNTKAMEVFLKKDSRMYRISYFVPEHLWDKTQSDIFWKMVYSFKTY